MTDAMGRVTDYDYDPQGRLTRTTTSLSTTNEAVQTYEYDATDKFVGISASRRSTSHNKVSVDHLAGQFADGAR